MDHVSRLEEVTREILRDPVDYQRLGRAIEDFGGLMTAVSGLDLDATDNRDDLHFTSGKALGTTWAAMCLRELQRTRQFVRGIHQAVRELRQRHSRPVHLLYVGTGPYATLLLPLTTQFTPEELRVTLMEVNPRTIDSLVRVMERLGITPYVAKIIEDNAATHTLHAPRQYDIFLSETMQQALVKEQQVPIMLNLLPQLRPATIIIPASIRLSLTSDRLGKDGQPQALLPLIDFGADYVRDFRRLPAAIQEREEFLLLDKHPLSALNLRTLDALQIATEIKTYGPCWIRHLESSLTIPWLLVHGQRIPPKATHFSLTYSWRNVPGYRLTFS